MLFNILNKNGLVTSICLSSPSTPPIIIMSTKDLISSGFTGIVRVRKFNQVRLGSYIGLQSLIDDLQNVLFNLLNKDVLL